MSEPTAIPYARFQERWVSRDGGWEVCSWEDGALVSCQFVANPRSFWRGVWAFLRWCV